MGEKKRTEDASKSSESARERDRERENGNGGWSNERAGYDYGNEWFKPRADERGTFDEARGSKACLERKGRAPNDREDEHDKRCAEESARFYLHGMRCCACRVVSTISCRRNQAPATRQRPDTLRESF